MKNGIMRYVFIAVLIFMIFNSVFHSEIYPEEVLPTNILDIEKNSAWPEIGMVMKREMPSESSIAITAAGAIPYYSELYTLDMLGLCDSNISKFPPVTYMRPGHRRIATPEYLKESRVNFILEHPLLYECNLEYLCDKDFTGDIFFIKDLSFLQNLRKVYLKTSPYWCLRMFYLTEEPTITEKIENNDAFIFCE